MNRAEYNAYDSKMANIVDPEKLKKELEINHQRIEKTSKYPTFASLVSGWGFLALFLLTGFLSGWTVGVLWVVATIAGAGIASSAIAGLIGHIKYRKYFRALKTQERLAKLQDDGSNHFDKVRLRLEKSLSQDLAYCVRKRMISRREADLRRQVLRPVVLPEDALTQEQERIREESILLNQTMSNFKRDAEACYATNGNYEGIDKLKDNISDDKHFEGKISVNAQERDEMGNPKVDGEGKPVMIGAEFNAYNDKDFALLLKGISQNLRNKLDSNVLPLPISIQVYDKDGNILDVSSDGSGVIIITNTDGEVIKGESNPLDIVADDILSKLPIDPDAEKKEQVEEQEAEGQPEGEAGADKDKEEEQYQAR